MAFELTPRVRIQPVQSQTGGLAGRVVPLQDRSAGSMLAIGEGAQDLGRAVTSLADQKQDHVDIGMSLRASSLYTEEDENAYDAPGGFLTTVGQGANDRQRKLAEDRMREQRSKIEQTLQNAAQKANFQQHVAHVDARSTSRANAHQVHHAKVFEAGERKASAEAGIREAIKFAGTEEGEVTRQLAMQHLDAWAELVGMPRAMLKNERQKATDEYHQGVVGRIVSDANNPPLAKMYFDKHKGEMSPDTEQKLGAYVKRASIDDESTRLAMTIAEKIDNAEVATVTVAGVEMEVGTWNEQLRQAGRPAPPAAKVEITPGAFLAKGLEATDKLFQEGKITAEVRDATRARISDDAQTRKLVAAEEANAAMSAAQQWLVEHPLASVESMPAEVYTAVEKAGQLPAMRSFASNHRYVTEPKAYAEIATLMEQPAALRRMQPAKLIEAYRGRLDDSDLRMLLSAHANASGKAAKADKTALSDNARIVEGFYKATGKPRDKALGDDGEADMYRYRQHVQSRIDAAGDGYDLQQILDDVAKDRVMLRRTDLGIDWLDSDEKAFSPLLSDEDRRTAYVNVGGEQVGVGELPTERPANDRSVQGEIMHQLQLEGVPASSWTEEMMMTLWVQAGRPKTAAELRAKRK